MLPASYEELNRLQATHWWYRAQCDAIRGLFRAHAPGRFRRVLDVGCGPGGFTRFVSSLADEACGADIYEPALEFARGYCPDIEFFKADANDLAGLPEGATYDLVTLFYLLCHEWADEDRVLASVRSRLDDNGLVLVADSAFPVLFRHHDKAARFVRRYTRSGLKALLERNGFSVLQTTYLNASLFLPVLLVALRDRLYDVLGYKSDVPPEINLSENSRLVNAAMYRLLVWERNLFARLGSPPWASTWSPLRKNEMRTDGCVYCC